MSNFTLSPQIEADSLFVRDLPLCQLRLFRQKEVPWVCLVPRKADIREIHQLTASDRAMLMDEIVGASHAIETLFKPVKVNVAALGNMVPQLHIHVVGRFKEDAAWPGPIWGRIPTDPRDADELDTIKAKLVAFDFSPRP
jgi:diadenosine tetraphosphate (Ap4A) HIT family hydrolase